ncbi:hypothetical protein [Psychroserpens sp.]|uniref:hypothetical protein n=1 Tax=Psychroserpens sp. TaxID=2020870 RepID=UPI003C73264D
MPKIVSYLLILIGGAIAIYAQAYEDQNQYILISGIVVLMVGVYTISRNIASKNERDERENNRE